LESVFSIAVSQNRDTDSRGRSAQPGVLADQQIRVICAIRTEAFQSMTQKQTGAARKNIKKAAQAAKRKRTIAKLPKKTRTALGKEAAEAAKKK